MDLYTYIRNFSSYGLPSFKLDNVDRLKLGGETKVPIKPIGIWSWYTTSNVQQNIFQSHIVEECFRALKPSTVQKFSEFGTFRMYLEYCLKDTELVYLLFEKETVLSFSVERVNSTALSIIEALHLGKSKYLLELFKIYGTKLGYFFNPSHFTGDQQIWSSHLLNSKNTYQGARNYCISEKVYEDVSVVDFSSMYPSTLLSSNLCYGICTIMTREEWLDNPSVQCLTSIPYRQHSDRDFEKVDVQRETFSYPTFDPDTDNMVIVINSKAEAFLPCIVKHFIKMRQFHQKKWKETKDVYQYNIQLGIKILINYLYGVMPNKDSELAYLPITIIIVTLSRYQLLGSYYFIKNLGYNVCYADTDSLMVVQ